MPRCCCQPQPGQPQATRISQVYTAPAKGQDGFYYLARHQTHHTELLLKLPGRAHEIVMHPDRQHLLIVSRRPGTWCLLYDLKQDLVVNKLLANEGQHFYGHAVFDPSGNFLYTTENDIASGQGLITKRDARLGYAITQQFPSGGIGPHQLLMLSDQRTLVIANGGILTRPDRGREKLNLESMTPNLSYLDSRDGTLIEQVALPPQLHQLSIRHIACNEQNTIAFAMQYQGDGSDRVPLFGTHQLGQSMCIAELPEQTLKSMNQYCGSVCFEPSGRYIAVSAPRGNRMVIWDTQSSELYDDIRCPDGCGVAAAGRNQFVFSNGRGGLYRYLVATKSLQRVDQVSPHGSRISWDNHLSTQLI